MGTGLPGGTHPIVTPTPTCRTPSGWWRPRSRWLVWPGHSSVRRRGCRLGSGLQAATARVLRAASRQASTKPARGGDGPRVRTQRMPAQKLRFLKYVLKTFKYESFKTIESQGLPKPVCRAGQGLRSAPPMSREIPPPARRLSLRRKTVSFHEKGSLACTFRNTEAKNSFVKGSEGGPSTRRTRTERCRAVRASLRRSRDRAARIAPPLGHHSFRGSRHGKSIQSGNENRKRASHGRRLRNAPSSITHEAGSCSASGKDVLRTRRHWEQSLGEPDHERTFSPQGCLGTRYTYDDNVRSLRADF